MANNQKNGSGTIYGFQESAKVWRIAIDGKMHPSDFVNQADIREWVRNMQENGMYEGYVLSFR